MLMKMKIFLGNKQEGWRMVETLTQKNNDLEEELLIKDVQILELSQIVDNKKLDNISLIEWYFIVTNRKL